MKLVLVGVSHHRAPVELRERVALDAEGAASLAASLADDCEVCVLSTCNRTELYLAGESPERSLASVGADALLALAGPHAAAVAAVIYQLEDESAALHLFRVAAGLDSLIPGEGEILGQVRDAFAGAATAGPLLDRVFRMALHAGRRARVETGIGESPASVPAAAAALAQQVFERLDGRRVLLVGAGRMSELTAKNLRSRGAIVHAVANRGGERGQELATRLGSHAITLDAVVDAVTEVDVVISSTGAPGFVLTEADLATGLRRRRGKPLLLVDLAVPRDVEPGLSRYDGCFLYDIDDLEAVVDSALAGRRAEAVLAERIVATEAVRFREWQASLSIVPAITSLRALAESIRTSELRKAEARLAGLGSDERSAVEIVTAQILNKLLHLPTVRLKESAVGPDGVVYAETVRYLFGLEEDQRP
ncbi:MAG: glutamyl-tRNA reductase [Gaiella sp.]